MQWVHAGRACSNLAEEEARGIWLAQDPLHSYRKQLGAVNFRTVDVAFPARSVDEGDASSSRRARTQAGGDGVGEGSP